MIYVMSDIHGQYRAYKQMLELIDLQPDDHVYVLGDAIDRGEDGGLLLVDVLTNPQTTLLLGNHEFMMVQSQNDQYQRNLWIRNGADPTIDQLYDLGFNIADLADLIREQCPVCIPNLQVDGREFCLSHAFPIRGYTETVYMRDLDESVIDVAVWTRDFNATENCQYHASTFPPDMAVVFGHTPVINCDYCRYDENGKPMISICPGTLFFNIDCGCAKNLRLGCLRLDDGKEFYIDL